MNAREYLDEFGAKEAARLAGAAGISPAYFKQIAYKFRRPSGPLCLRLEEKSGGKLTRAELRPDIYGEPGTDSAASSSAA